MPFNPQIVDDLAIAGAHIVIDAATANPQEVSAVVAFWVRSTGNVTIRNASRLPPNVAIEIARARQPSLRARFM
jgi:hypothetical protein